jgi:hypothetical protein
LKRKCRTHPKFKDLNVPKKIYKLGQEKTVFSNYTIYIQGGPKKSLWCDLEEKCLRNSKIFFDGVFLSIYSHIVKKLELENPENG